MKAATREKVRYEQWVKAVDSIADVLVEAKLFTWLDSGFGIGVPDFRHIVVEAARERQ